MAQTETSRGDGEETQAVQDDQDGRETLCQHSNRGYCVNTVSFMDDLRCICLTQKIGQEGLDQELRKLSDPAR